MASVRSALLFLGRVANNTPAEVFVVPVGHTAILKTINGQNANAQAAQLIVSFSTPQVALRNIIRVNSATLTSFSLAPWIVLPEGGKITLQAGGAVGYDVLLSGTVLAGVVPT